MSKGVEKMIICKIIPKMGLGNQLFVYATAYALAKERQSDLALDISDYNVHHRSGRILMLENFNISASYLQKERQLRDSIFNKLMVKIQRVFRLCLRYKRILEAPEDSSSFCPKYFDIQNKNLYLEGYWQNYRYFQKYAKDLRQEFVYIMQKSEILQKLEVKVKNEESVAVHIRLSDYPEEWRLPEVYYEKAIFYIKKKCPNAVFYIFCEEPESAEKIVGKYVQALYVSSYGLSDMEEFLLMSKCKYFVIANSTYSWWAAWLSNAEGTSIFAPQKGIWGRDFYPEEWQVIDCRS